MLQTAVGRITIAVPYWGISAYNILLGAPMFEILYAEGVADELQRLRARDRALVVDRIKEQLRYEPSKPTRVKKLIHGLKAPWLVGRQIWQLRVGQYRVFYDADENLLQVTVRAIRRKPPHRTTEQIL